MAAVWQMRDAESRFDELLDKAATEGPQVIIRHGRPVAKVVSLDPAAPDRAEDDGFVEYLLSAPKSGLEQGLPPMPRWGDDQAPPFGGEG